MSLAVLKLVSVVLLVLTAGIPVYFAKAWTGERPKRNNVWATPADAPVHDVAWARDGNSLHGSLSVARFGTHNVATYRVGQREPSFQFDGYRSATAVAVTADGSILFGTDNGDVLRSESGGLVHILKTVATDSAIQNLVALDRGRIAVGWGSFLQLIGPRGEPLWPQSIAWEGLNSLAASADGRTLVAGSHRHRIAVIDVCTGRIRHVIETRNISPVATISPDGRHVYSGGMDGTLTAWDAGTGEIEWMRNCGEQQVSALDISPDGKRIAAGGWNNAVTVWSEAGTLLETVPVSRASVVRFSPDGRSLALCTSSGGLQVIPVINRF